MIDALMMAELFQFVGMLVPMCTFLIILYIIVLIRDRSLKVKTRKVRVEDD